MLGLLFLFLSGLIVVLLVVVGAFLLARLLRRWIKGRWYWPLIGTIVVGWVVLPTAIVGGKLGYHVENGMIGAALVSSFNYERRDAPAKAAEICGDAEGFDVKDPTLRYVYMPVKETIKRFFYYSSYSNIVWAGVGWKDRYCLARYRVTVSPSGYPVPFPVQVFPYPYFRWHDSADIDYKLLDRVPLRRPSTPEGVRALFPGECWAGKIGTGETLRFQVEMPEVGPENALHVANDCVDSIAYHWTRNGVPIDGKVDKLGGKAVYQIELQGPSPRPKGYAIPYQVGVYWGKPPGCREKRWDERCPEKNVEEQ
jgi:hypothetical protein